MTDALANRQVTLREYLEILRRRKWVVIVVPLVAVVAALGLTMTQSPVYQDHASVLVNRSVGVSAGITGVDPSTADATRYLSTQASIARSPGLLTRVADADHVQGLTLADILASSSVAPRLDADVLDFVVTNGDAETATDVVNAYAREFTSYKSELDTVRIQGALRVVRARLAGLESRGQGASATAQTLAQYESQLVTAVELIADSTSVLEPATGAVQISPSLKRNLMVAGLLGVVLALGLALVAEALDRRTRTEDEIARLLRVPLMGRIPMPPGDLRSKNQLVMLAQPMSAQAESIRKLRATIEFANREYGTRTLMFTSGSQGEGKSTTVANLAVAFARAGRRVVLVDLDIRRPSLHAYFGLKSNRGIVDVAAHGHSIEQVIQRVPLSHARPATSDGLREAARQGGRWGAGSSSATPQRSNGAAGQRQFLDFVACGTMPGIDDAFLASEPVSVAMAELGGLYDIVLVDAPPFLVVGEAMSLSEKVDGIVVVSHLGTSRQVLEDLSRGLEQSPARTLGFVLTGVAEGDPIMYGDDYRYGGYDPAETDVAAATSVARRA